MTTHPPRRELEQLSVDDVATADRAREIDEHVRGCETCEVYLRELAAERDAMLAARAPADFAARIKERAASNVVPLRSRVARRVGSATVVLTAAAVLALVLRKPPEGDGSVGVPGGVILKGRGISLMRNRDAQVRALAESDTIRGGDGLRVIVTQQAPARVAGWYLDARGNVDAAFPGGAVQLGAGQTPAPGSVVVDTPCVDMTLVVVALGDRETFDELDQRVRRARATQGDADIGAWAPPGAFVRKLRCE